LLKDLPENDKV